MDVNELRTALNGFLDFADTLDSNGVGISAMTNGQHTTREICKMELGAYLLYIGDAAPSFTDDQAELVNLVLGDMYGQMTASQMKSAAAEQNTPDPASSMTYQAFDAGDEALPRQKGKKSTQCRDLMSTVYGSFGALMTSLNENTSSRIRYNSYILGIWRLKTGNKARSSASKTTAPAASPVSAAMPDVDIDRYIPAGVTLTENQRGYLAGVVGTMQQRKEQHVRTADVAFFMKKDSSAVSSGVRTLVKKGILEINDDAEIVIADHSGEAEEEPKPAAVAPAPKPAPAAKKTAAKKASGKAKGGKAEFDERISFMLSSGYEMHRETTDEGEEKTWICFGPGKDENGNETWEFNPELGTLEIQDAEDDRIPAGESPLETVVRRNKEVGAKYIMLDEGLKAGLLMREAPINILGRVFNFYALMLVVEKDGHNVYTLTSARQWDEDEPEKNEANYQHIIDMIGAIRIDGKALPAFDKSAGELMEEMAPEFDGKTSIKGSIGLQIRSGDKVVSETQLVGDDEGNVHRLGKDGKEIEMIKDGKYGEVEIRDGYVKKCLKKAVSVEIPKGVVGIDSNAFEKCTKLEKVVIPDGVAWIGSSAFDGCTKLKEILIPDSVEFIGMFAFDGCKNLMEVNLPASMTCLNMNMFNDCEKLTRVTIPPSVESIHSGAFSGCAGLKEIELPAGLKELSGGLFWKCESLTSVSIPESITEIPPNLFNGCKNLKSVSIPDGVTKIGRWAFAECEKLEKIEIPENVDNIESYAFYHCNKLKTVTIPSQVTVIDENLFDGCENLTEVVLPAGLDRINEFAFSECKKLKKIEIPSGVSEIGRGAFSECASLTSITIPEQVTEIPDGLCEGCGALKTAVFAGNIESIGDNAFNRCGSLQKAKFPDSLKTIGDMAFNECTSLTEIVIPDNVETIGDYGFDDCENLRKISMPGHEVEVGNYGLPDEDEAQITFRGAGGKIVERKPGSEESWDADDSDDDSDESGGFTILDGILFRCSNKELEEAVIPDGVTTLSSRVFKGFPKLRSVKIPDSVTEIEMSAFSECPALEGIEIPDSVTELQGWVFEDCTGLKKVKLPAGITSIGTSLFKGCTSLTDVEIPEGVTTIESMAFNGCSALTEIMLPDSIEKIESWAFDNCSSLETIYLPDKEIETSGRLVPEKTDIVKLPVGDAAARKAARQAHSTEKYTRVMPADEIYSHYGKLKREHDKFANMGIRHESKNGTEHEAIPLAALMERQGKTDNATYRALKAIEARDTYDLKALALKMAQVFRVDQPVFNARHDDEGEIGVTMLDKKWKFSALRSFAWTLADLADREGKNIDDYDTDDLLGICRFIKKREWLNYEAGSWFDGLCGHNDIHVFYMPQKMIDDGSADAVCDLFTFSPIVSLDQFRNELGQLKNPMIRLHNKLLENRDRSVRLDSPEAAVLKAWCSMVMSAETPFFSEDGPMMFFHSYPETPANTRPIPVEARAAALKKAAPKAKKEEASAVMNSAGDYEVVKGPDGKCRIKIGSYPAGSPIVWLVLENNRSDLLLISEYGLDAKAYNDISYKYEKEGEFGESTNEWPGCSLRQWLNNEFSSEAFTEAERGMILEDTHDTYNMNNRGEVEEKEKVKDKVFLLSAREVKKYFPGQRDKICKATDFAKQQGAEIENGPMQCHWWCRSPGVELMPGLHGWAGCIMADGQGKGWGITADGVCVRPVIRIKADGIKNAVAAPLSGKAIVEKAEEDVREIKKTAAETLERVQNDVANTKSALEKHAEHLRKQEEEKEKRIQEAKARGKTDKDQTDMLAVLLNEESLGFLDRAEDEFVEIYAEDFGAYNEAQLKKLRKKVLPKIHDSGFVEAAKEDMLSRPVKDRFMVSTGNWFNVSNHWNFKEKGEMAIDNTRLWYRDDELDEVRRLMEDHKKEACDSVDRQLTGFNETWNGFSGVKNDLHIDIAETEEEVSPKHDIFDVKLNSRLRVQILLRHPSMGFLTIPVMNLFASVWNVTPEQIWNAALNNTMDDSRGVSARTKTDAQAAKTKALEQIRAPKAGTAAAQNAAAPVSAGQADEDTKKTQKRESLTNRIAALEKERDAATGLLNFMKRRRLQAEIDNLKAQLRSL